MNWAFRSEMPVALITGLYGFTGRYLADELRSAGYSIVGIGQKEEIHADAQCFKCDLNDRQAVWRAVHNISPDVVVHLAAIAFAAHDNADEIYRTNIVGTRNLLEALVHSSRLPRSVLLASSANIYGNATVTPIDELTSPAPANDYAVSKLAMEQMARLWFDKLPITFIRPFNYTGVGQSSLFLLPKIVDHFKRRAPVIELGNLEVIRDFSDVRTVVRCYRLLIEAAQRGEVFNICSGIGHSLQDVISIMRKLSGHHLDVVVNPAFVRGNEVHKLIGSRAKLEAAIGQMASIPMQETLQWMLEADWSPEVQS